MKAICKYFNIVSGFEMHYILIIILSSTETILVTETTLVFMLTMNLSRHSKIYFIKIEISKFLLNMFRGV